MTQSSEQLEREAERTRSDLGATLDELRSRITPGQVMDQTLDFARDTNLPVLARNLARDARDNPLPLLLIGAGVAWLMFGKGRPAMRNGDGYGAAFERTGQPRSHIAGDVGSRGRELAQNAGEWASDTSQRVKEGAASATQQMSESARRTADWAASAASAARGHAAAAYDEATSSAASAARRLGRSTTAARQGLVEFCCNHPLVMAGLGIAAGAALGSALPSTETENNAMGETSDRLKQGVHDFVADTAGNVTDAATTLVPAAAEPAEAS